jgi:hypothetical protein
MSAMASWRLGGSLRPVLLGGLVGAFGAPLVALFAVFVFEFLIAYPAAQYEALGQRVTTLESAPHPEPRAAALEPMVNDLLRRITENEHTLSTYRALLLLLSRQAMVGACIKQLKTASIGIDQYKNSAQDKAVHPELHMMDRDTGPTWESYVLDAQNIILRCYPAQSIDIRREPSREEMTSKVNGEPVTHDYDEIQRFRHFAYIQRHLDAAILSFSQQLTGEQSDIDKKILLSVLPSLK